MNMMNQVTIMGRLTAAPELRTTPSGIAVCSFYLAVDRPHRKSDEKERETDFFRIVAWRNDAEFICKYFSKGDPMLLTGALRNTQYKVEGEEKPRTQTEIVVREIYYSGNKAKTAENADNDYSESPESTEPAADTEELMI